MLNRCQSDLILSDRFIETHYKRVDKNLDKCKALLKGIQKEFKKTRDFWDQLKIHENSVEHKSGLTCKNQNIDLKGSLMNGNGTSKHLDGSSKDAEESAKNVNFSLKTANGSTKNADRSSKDLFNSQYENMQFSKISKLDVKHLEAFLDIVQKAQVSKYPKTSDSSSIDDNSSECDIFEDALSKLPSVTSLNVDRSLTSSDKDSSNISLDVLNSHSVEKTTKLKQDGKEDSHNMPSSDFQQLKAEEPPAYFRVSPGKSVSSKLEQNDACTDTNLSDNCKIFNAREEFDYSRILENIRESRDIVNSKSGRFKNESELTSFDESDSEEYQEAHDFNTGTIEENSYFLHVNDPNNELCVQEFKNMRKLKSGFNETDMIRNKAQNTVGSYRPTNNFELLNANRTDKVVKFSGTNITYQNDRSLVMFQGSGVERKKGVLDNSPKKTFQAEKENRSRPRNRLIKQRKLVKAKDRSKTRSRSRKKSFHDMATNTSDFDIFEHFHPWPQRLLKHREPFYSLPAKRRHYDYSTEEPSGIFHPSLLQPHNFSNQDFFEKYQDRNESMLKKHMSWNSLFKQPLSNNELSDNGSNNTYSLKRSSSSDRFSIHNSTILNNSNTNVFVFRSFEDRLKQLQATDSDVEICPDNNLIKPVEQHNNYSGSESSRGNVSSTDERKTKVKSLSKHTVGRTRQSALHDEKYNFPKEIEQKNYSGETRISQKGPMLSKIHAIIPYVGYIHSDLIEVPQCTKLVNETKILFSKSKLRNNSHEVLKVDDWETRKQKDSSLNNKTKFIKNIIESLDSEKHRVPSREEMRYSSLSSSSKREDKELGSKRSSKEDCRIQGVNGRGDIYISELYKKSPHSSLTSLNRDFTGSKFDRRSTKSVLEPRLILKISPSSDNVQTEKISSNEHLLTTVNLTKSSSSCSGLEPGTYSKLKMKKCGKRYVSCNDLVRDDPLYSKINIIPLEGNDKGHIQLVSIVGQNLWVQGATISAYKNSFTEQEEGNKAEHFKPLSASGDNRRASSSKKSVGDNNNEKSNEHSKNTENRKVSREVTNKHLVQKSQTTVNIKKNDKSDSKPLFCPYVNRNYTTNQNSNIKAKGCKSSQLNKAFEKRIQTPPKLIKPKVEDNYPEVDDKERTTENNEKMTDIDANLKESFESGNSNSMAENFSTENFNDESLSNLNVFCSQTLTVTEGDIKRGIDIDENCLNMNSEIETGANDEVKELDDTHLKDKRVKIQTDTNSSTKIQRNTSDAILMKRKTQQNIIGLKDHRQLSKEKLKMRRSRSPQRRGDSSSEENNDKFEELKRIRQNLCTILPNNSPIKQIILRKLSGGDNDKNNEEVDVFGAPLINSSGDPFYNEYGYPVANMSGVSLYNRNGIPTKGAYGRPLHTTLRKELEKIVEGSEERRNIFHRMNRNFEELLLHALSTISNVRMDMYGRVYDSYGRPLFDRYGYLLYDHIGNPLTDAFGRKLTDKYGISIMGIQKKCANAIMLNTISVNESPSSHYPSDKRLVKNRTELVGKPNNSKESMRKKCERQVSFNMDPTIITVNHSDSEVETSNSTSNFKR